MGNKNQQYLSIKYCNKIVVYKQIISYDSRKALFRAKEIIN